MYTSLRSIHARLDAADLAIRAALDDPDVLRLLAARSYDKKTLKAGEDLLEKARALHREARHRRGAQHGATHEIRTRVASVKKEYTAELALARIAFRGDPEAGTQLGLSGTRRRALAGWIEQAQQFYGTLSADAKLAARLEPMGINEAVLAARHAALKTLQDVRLRQALARGDAQELTRQRRAVMAELDAWMRRFLAVARIALQDRPQLVEKLGITARG